KIGDPFFGQLCRRFIHLEPEEILYLCTENDHCNTTGKAHDQRVGYKPEVIPKSCKPHGNDEKAGEKSRDGKSPYAMFLNNSIYDDDERSGRSAYLNPTATQKRNDEPGYNRGEEPFFR